MMRQYQHLGDLPATIPLFPLSGALVLPRTDLPLNIFEPRYLAMVEHAMAGERIIGLIQPLEGDTSAKPKLEQIGCAARITSYSEADDGRYVITITGICRFQLRAEVKTKSAFRQGTVDYAPYAADLVIGEGAPLVNRNQLLEAFRQFLEKNDMTTDWNEVHGVATEVLVNTLSLLAPYSPRDKQALLEARDLASRADVLIALTELALKRSLSGGSTRIQ